MSKINLTEEGVSQIIDFFIDDMRSYIDDEWENVGCGEKMTRKEAATYLGHSVKSMSKEEIDEEVSSVQKAYYTEGEASDQEVVDTFLKMINT